MKDNCFCFLLTFHLGFVITIKNWKSKLSIAENTVSNYACNNYKELKVIFQLKTWKRSLAGNNYKELKVFCFAIITNSLLYRNNYKELKESTHLCLWCLCLDVRVITIKNWKRCKGHGTILNLYHLSNNYKELKVLPSLLSFATTKCIR